ncbi:calcium-binding protein [Pseudodonghicola flavimaris]|uniref:Calcium-binding protein n=1 Tax=Pseudodonghicola flavimaris TaxID=3050036 RepID=A0ABT7EXW2_9RHOB|nr:hypothetical protein [Pseudodonghicola flavimaris]MDK3017184.1 hypothetical protein [Pseudodonghicola flavimaris]
MDFFVKGPLDRVITGTAEEDRLVYTLVSGAGGVLLETPVPSAGGGYSGVFQTAEGENTSFTGIEVFKFSDLVGGDDIITTAAGDDVLLGRGGNDVLNGNAGYDNLIGGTGNDKIYGGLDGDTLDGGNGFDKLFGEDGHDSLYGGKGNDRIYGGADNDFIDGGAGDDRLFGGSGDDFIIADSGDDLVDAGLGDDQVEISFDGVKTVDGGNGHDFLMLFHFPAVPVEMTLTFNLGTGVFTAADAVISASSATGFEDFAFQGEIDIKVIGTAGANQLFGSAGDDLLRGNNGKDALFGEDGDDTLQGGNKADALDGGYGDDTLTGGGGQDSFTFYSGHDLITDFTDDIDTIVLHSSLFAEGTTVEDVVAAADVIDGNTVIGVDGDTSLTISGLTDTSLLLNDMILV